MPEKLLTIKETCLVLGLSEEQVRDLVARGELPAYKIGGRFLRFRKEQIEAIQKELTAKPARELKIASLARRPKRPAGTDAPGEKQTFRDKVLDFFYFQDFYIVSAVLIVITLFIIFKP